MPVQNHRQVEEEGAGEARRDAPDPRHLGAFAARALHHRLVVELAPFYQRTHRPRAFHRGEMEFQAPCPPPRSRTGPAQGARRVLAPVREHPFGKRQVVEDKIPLEFVLQHTLIEFVQCNNPVDEFHLVAVGLDPAGHFLSDPPGVVDEGELALRAFGLDAEKRAEADHAEHQQRNGDGRQNESLRLHALQVLAPQNNPDLSHRPPPIAAIGGSSACSPACRTKISRRLGSSTSNRRNATPACIAAARIASYWAWSTTGRW